MIDNQIDIVDIVDIDDQIDFNVNFDIHVQIENFDFVVVVQKHCHLRYLWEIFNRCMKNESIETSIDLIDLTTILLHCVHFAIDIDVIIVVDKNVDYNFDCIVETIEYNFVVVVVVVVVVVSTYHVVF